VTGARGGAGTPAAQAGRAQPDRRRARGDFTPSDFAVALFVALAIQAAAAMAIRKANLSSQAAAPAIEKGEIPVKVIPVLDMDTPLLKLGGKRDKMKLPDRWVRQTPKPRVEEKAFVTPKAGKTEEDIPPPEVKIADAGTEVPPPDAEVAKEVDTEIDPTQIDAGDPANVDQEGHQDGVAEGTEADPLKARAVDLYLARIAGWFSSRFRVSGSGLSADELTKYKPRAVIILSGGRMQSYSLTPSGNPTFDAAARATLEGAKGQSLPPPPENYPDLGEKQVAVTFVCRETTCD